MSDSGPNLFQLASNINPWRVKQLVEAKPFNAQGQRLREHLCDIFNKIEGLLREVLRISKTNRLYKPGQVCLTQVWQRYGDLVQGMFTNSQQTCLVQLSRQIQQENIFAQLICYKPGVGGGQHPYAAGERLDLRSCPSLKMIQEMFLTVYTLEQLEFALYRARGYPLKLEPFLMTLFHSQVKEGACALGMLLVKWYARLHFAQLAPLPEDLKPDHRERTFYNLSNDLF